MFVVEENTEVELMQDLRSLWQDKPNDRCFYLRSSGLKIEKNIWLPIFLKTLQTYFSDDINKIYLCHDNDIFVTSKTFTEKQISILLTHLNQQLAPASLNGLASLFELKVDWAKLRMICEKKMEDLDLIQNARSFAVKEKVGKVSSKEALQTLNKDLVSSLAMRREGRGDTMVMVVEDDLFSQKLIKNAIGTKHNLSISSDGQGAVMTYVNKAPDMLFLDIGLPDIDGLSVLKKIFEIDPKAYVVMFSGNGDKENVLKAIELGASGFVGKPFTKDQIHKYIDKCPYIKVKQHKEMCH